jgi:hypothetical protein
MSLAGDSPWQRAAFLVSCVCFAIAAYWSMEHQSQYFDFLDNMTRLLERAILFEELESEHGIAWVVRIGLVAAVVRVAGRSLHQWLFRASAR